MKGVVHKRVTDHYRISTIEDWRLIRAADVLRVQGVGKGYLNKLRLWLAHKSINLRDDNTPAYWLEVLTKRVKCTGKEPHSFGVCPFTIIVDSNETFPFMFTSMTDSDGNIVNVPTVREPLWTLGLADYSIRGMEEDIQIERKSLEDLLGTLSGRRENFEAEIARLDGLCSYAAIVCEAQWSDILHDTHEHGPRAKSVSRTFLSWSIKYPRVHWIMCAGREHAEIVTYQLLKKFWWQAQKEESVMERNPVYKA
ncbi:MAG: hypothetical protein GY826_16580, partial [Fuerstiella sp.]|nr:hypothetical protein [Fuerstiella sp.]